MRGRGGFAPLAGCRRRNKFEAGDVEAATHGAGRAVADELGAGGEWVGWMQMNELVRV